MIQFSNLILNNFFSHTSTSLPINNYEGLILIEGENTDGHYSSNGSGKSTLLEGIIYALTGDTLRGVSVNDVVNRNYGKNTRVSLEFKKEGVDYKVDRYRKDDKFGDSLLLSKETSDISKRLNKETQKSLDDILGISYKVLISTMLLGEGLSSRFTQLSDPEKKSLIESTLNLNYDIPAIRVKANDNLSKLKLEKSNLDGRISALKELSDFDLKEAEFDVSVYEAKTSSAAKHLELSQQSLASMKANYDEVANKLNILRNSLSQRDKIEEEINILNTEFLNYLKELERIEDEEVPCCNICHQSLSSEESILAFKNSYKEKIDSVSQRINTLRESIESMPERSLIEDKYKLLSIDLDNITNEMTTLNQRIADIANKRWEYQSLLDKLRLDIKRYNDTVEDIDSLELKYKLLGDDIDKYDYFYKLFSPTGIVVNILSEAIDYINTRLSVYSEVLLEKDYKINFIKGKITLVDSKGSSYQSLSNGEKRRLDIAIQFSLHDYVTVYCGNNVDTMFIDEILDTLDNVGIENIITVLRLKLDYCNLSRIFVISHNSELKSYFDKFITVVKDENGDSKIK